jgi:hypothetical protein
MCLTSRQRRSSKRDPARHRKSLTMRQGGLASWMNGLKAAANPIPNLHRVMILCGFASRSRWLLNFGSVLRSPMLIRRLSSFGL